MAKTVVVVREPEDRRAAFSVPVAEALEACFARLGWSVRRATDYIRLEPDLVAGWGFREVIHEAWHRWPERILHVDAGFWTRDQYCKLELGGRWLPATGGDYPLCRFQRHNVKVSPTRSVGTVVLVCGMSAKAAISCHIKPESWERDAVARLVAVGARVIYRPKPTWAGAKEIAGASFQRVGSIEQALERVHGVVSHHSNTAVDALAAGLPVYVEQGIAKPLAVPTLEDIVCARAPNIEAREKFLREVAWRQWTLEELERGTWLKPPAPLSNHPLLKCE